MEPKFSTVLSTAVPVSGLIPVLRRSDGSCPQASCHLSLVFPSFIVSQAPSSRWALNSFQSGKTFGYNLTRTAECFKVVLQLVFFFLKLARASVTILGSKLIFWGKKLWNKTLLIWRGREHNGWHNYARILNLFWLLKWLYCTC